MRLSRRLAGVLLVLYLLAVASVVLWPTDWVAALSEGDLRALKHESGAPTWITTDDVGFVANVMLFMPLGFLGSRLLTQWRWTNWLMAGVVAASAVEMSQMLFLSRRDPSVSDVIANTLGIVLGYLLAGIVLRNRDARDK